MKKQAWTSRYILLWALCIAQLFLFPITYADTSYGNDCVVYANTDVKKYPGVVEKWLEEWDLPSLQFYTPQDLETVVRHHQMACCEDVLMEDRAICQQAQQEMGDCENCYPHSTYFFDHLVNVGMRKFDGIQEHCDSLHISCEMNASAVRTQEWRERITEIAEDVEGYPPSLLMEEFLEYWGDMSSEDINDPDKIANAYYGLCQEAANVRSVIWVNAVADSSSSDLYSRCRALVEERYMQEYQYVRTLMVEKWVQYFVQNTRDYLQDYFLKWRMDELVNKYARMDNCFTTVLRYATKTSCCSN